MNLDEELALNETEIQNKTPRLEFVRCFLFVFLLNFSGLRGLKPHVVFVPLSSGHDIIGVVLPSCVFIDTFIRLDILLTLIVGS